MAQKDKELYCKDIGMKCDFLACGMTDEEALSKLGQHVLATHGIEGFSKEFYNKARSAIREGYCPGDAEQTTSEGYSWDYEAYFDCADKGWC